MLRSTSSAPPTRPVRGLPMSAQDDKGEQVIATGMPLARPPRRTSAASSVHLRPAACVRHGQRLRPSGAPTAQVVKAGEPRFAELDSKYLSGCNNRWSNRQCEEQIERIGSNLPGDGTFAVPLSFGAPLPGVCRGAAFARGHRVQHDYRHAYHAAIRGCGEASDTGAGDRLSEAQGGPIRVVDTHAGPGLYALSATEAERPVNGAAGSAACWGRMRRLCPPTLPK